MDSQMIMLGSRRVPVTLRRHRGARRISLRMTAAGDGVVLTLPPRGSEAKALAFLQQKAGWVLSHLRDVEGKRALQDGAVISVLGQEVKVTHHAGRGVSHIEAGQLHVYGDAAFTQRRVRDFVKKEFQAYALMKAQSMAAQLGVKVSTIRQREMESRWGSCSQSGSITFNWRLVFAPQHVIDYLIAHEVAHLREMNHSPHFWKHVAALFPEYTKAKRWLKQHGQGLYRWE